MPRAYESKWMSGAEALAYLNFIDNDLRARFRVLQQAIRDRAIRGRAKGRESDRSYRVSKGLTPDPDDPDYAPQVDDRWRNEFIHRDPDSIDLVRRSAAQRYSFS
jgi:hypothetical protein